MAGSYVHSFGRASAGGGGTWPEQQLLLPSGACGYRDLNGGAAAPTCGCRRFWLSMAAVSMQQSSERAWCYCGHHACFHEAVALPQALGIQALEESHSIAHAVQRPAAEYGPPQQYATLPTWSQLIEDNTRNNNTAAGASGSTVGLGIRHVSQAPSRSTNSRLWHALNGFSREQDSGSKSGDTSKLPSTAVPSVVDEPECPARAPPVQGRHTMAPPLNMPPSIVTDTRAEQYSATEVATPSIRGTPELNVASALGVSVVSPAREGHTLQNAAQFAMQRHIQGSESSPLRARLPTVGPSLSIQEMCNTIQNYGRRIDILETMSFTHLPSDEVIDRFDMMDGRLLDIEQWRTDQDRAQETDDVDERLDAIKSRVNELEHWRETEPKRPEDASSSMRDLLPDTSSFASDGSFDSEAAAQTEAIVLATLAANAETRPRLDALENRITDLENTSLPSLARPWAVQVVILPFGRQLSGIWFSSSESTQQSRRTATQASEEWPGPTLQFTAKSSFNADDNTGAWTTRSIEAWARRTEDEFLSAKACGPSGTVFKRLESRGLVQDIVLTSPDALHFSKQIALAFGNVLGERAACDGLDRFRGLRESFIPLRKVRQSSRLRFLTKAEMVTSAIWNASMLESVFMRVHDGQRRLYMTTPEAYTQPLSPGWTWPSLRNLPMYGADGELQAAQLVGTVVESCWTFKDRLDHSSSLNSSFASQGSPWGMLSASPENNYSDLSKELASQIAPPDNAARPGSLPRSISAHGMELGVLSERRGASVGMNFTISATEDIRINGSKRRRISSSPELACRGADFTPRWSREPPSPFTSDDHGLARSQATSSRPRGTTPFAYMTPHSNLDSRDDDGDTEVDTEAPIVHSENGDDTEEWEGMRTDREDGNSLSGDGSFYGEDDALSRCRDD